MNRQIRAIFAIAPERSDSIRIKTMRELAPKWITGFRAELNGDDNDEYAEDDNADDADEAFAVGDATVAVVLLVGTSNVTEIHVEVCADKMLMMNENG